MKTHKFKVGDKGMLRCGQRPYEVMFLDPAMPAPVVVRILRGGTREAYYSQRHVDGTYTRNRQSPNDLMPPKEVVIRTATRSSAGAFLARVMLNTLRVQLAMYGSLSRKR